jgi:rhamnosyltransferase
MIARIEEKNNPKVLVLLASYNGKPWIAEQLDSILAQESVSICIYISDDASTDDTEQLIHSVYGQDKRIVYQRWDTPSGSAGANFRRLYRTSDLADFDFIALADQDDIWDKHKMTSAISAMSQTGTAGYSCSVMSFWPDGRHQVLSQAPVQRAADFLFEGAGQGKNSAS